MDIIPTIFIIIITLIFFIISTLKDWDASAAFLKIIVLTVAFLGDFSNIIGFNGVGKTRQVSFLVILIIYTFEILEVILDMVKKARNA